MRLIIICIIQSLLLAGGQVFLKYALRSMGSFSWSLTMVIDLFTNWWWLACGLCYTGATVLCMYIAKHYSLSQSYPLISLSFIFGMMAAMLFFHENVPYWRWIGVGLIIAGCVLIAK